VTGTTHVLLDFFGTIVDYSPSRTEQGYHESHNFVTGLDSALTYDEFLGVWSSTSAAFDRRADVDDREFSMTDVATAVLSTATGRAPGRDEVVSLVEHYLRELNTGVTYPEGIAEVLAALSATHHLAVVTNTHDLGLVPDHLEAMGVASFIDVVVTSIGVGWRKPHPAIYDTALTQLGIDAAAAVFVGDTLEADFDGPRRHGMGAYLIDPERRTSIAGELRHDSLSDLPQRLQLA
jgi:putative hydrolase of the HAD superfamily